MIIFRKKRQTAHNKPRILHPQSEKFKETAAFFTSFFFKILFFIPHIFYIYISYIIVYSSSKGHFSIRENFFYDFPDRGLKNWY